MVKGSDVLFKSVMYENEDIFKSILELLLDTKIKKIKFLNTEMTLKSFIEKGKRLDIYVEDEDTYIDIEVTTNYYDFIINRNLAYEFNIYCKTVEKGNKYDEYKNVKSINIIYNKKSKEKIRNYYLRDETGKLLSKKLLYSEIYIDNFVKMYYNQDVENIKKYKYLIMLGLDLEELIKFNEEYGDKMVKKYKDFVVEFSTKEEEIQPLFSKEEDEQRIRNSYKFLGNREGQELKQIEIAKNMLNEKCDIKLISKVTGLSIEEINNLN